MCFLSVLPIPTFSRTRGYAHHLLQAVFLRYCHMYLSDSETCISPAHPYFLPDEGGTIIICVTAAPASSNLPPLHIASTFQSTSCILVASLDRSSIYVSMQEGTHHHQVLLEVTSVDVLVISLIHGLRADTLGLHGSPWQLPCVP